MLTRSKCLLQLLIDKIHGKESCWASKKSVRSIQNLGSHFHSSLKTSQIFSDVLQNYFTSPTFSMNYWTVLSKRRSQVNIHMKFYGTSEFLHSGYVASKIHPGGEYGFWSKISQSSQKSGFHCCVFLLLRSHIGCNMVILFLLNRNLGLCLLSIPSIIKLPNGLSFGKICCFKLQKWIYWEKCMIIFSTSGANINFLTVRRFV